jgi:hypothetical protein
MELYAGIDLHSSNNYIGIIDEQNNRVFGKRVENHLPYVLEAMEPYQKELKAVVVKSTYNWYWLVDGLQERIVKGLDVDQKTIFCHLGKMAILAFSLNADSTPILSVPELSKVVARGYPYEPQSYPIG